MELLEQTHPTSGLTHQLRPVRTGEDAERAARRSLRSQIARLERELADAFVTAYSMGGLEQPTASSGEARLLDLGELERVRDELAERLRAARVTIAERADVQAANRLYLERMLLEPGKHRFARVSRQDIGESGCGAWQVRPRLGLIGMLMGWWQVKLSSGCPLATGRATARPADLSGSGQRDLTSPPSLWAELSSPGMRELLRTGAGAFLVLLIMFIGSLVLWIGTPLVWLWIGGQVQGATRSLGTAIGAMFIGVVVSIALIASLLAKLSNVYRANCRARGLEDPGHFVLEGVLVVSAGLTLAAFVIWFFFFAGTSPLPIGIQF